jgi:hypothetical protein
VWLGQPAEGKSGRASAVRLTQDAIEHLHDDLLLSFGQAVEPLDLLLQQRWGAALAGAVFMQSQKLIDAHPEELREVGSIETAGRAREKGQASWQNAHHMGVICPSAGHIYNHMISKEILPHSYRNASTACPDTLSIYAYVGGNPINRIDPRGGDQVPDTDL